RAFRSSLAAKAWIPRRAGREWRYQENPASAPLRVPALQAECPRSAVRRHSPRALLFALSLLLPWRSEWPDVQTLCPRKSLFNGLAPPNSCPPKRNRCPGGCHGLGVETNEIKK